MILSWDGAISSFPDLHVETWLHSTGIKPFAHVICNWEKANKRLGNNSGQMPGGLKILKGAPLNFGVWLDNMRTKRFLLFCRKKIAGDFHAKTTIYYEEI